jgi:MtaA/CmuA family methyltransferase
MPFAEACSICGVSEFMIMIMDEPVLAHKLLCFITDVVIDFAVAQIEAGAPMVGAGDAAASLISPDLYREFALPYEKRVCEAVHRAGGLVKLHICGNTGRLMNSMVQSGADLFNVDHMVDLLNAAGVYGAAGKCFKGNLDPVGSLLQASPELCKERAVKCIKTANGTRFMLSPGCEIPAAVTDEVFEAFCAASFHVG